MNIIEQIKAEIERLKIKYRKDILYKSGRESHASGYKIEAYNELLSFLDTLESEKTLGLEEEYKDYVESDPVYSKLVNRNAGLSLARHFAQWQKEQMMENALRGWLDEDNEPPYDLNVVCEEKIPFGKFKHGDRVHIIIVKKN